MKPTTIIILSILTLCLCSCGFKPLYGSHHVGKSLSQIKIGKISYESRLPSKASIELKSVLAQELGWSYTETSKLYSININFQLIVEGAAIQVNSIATRNNLRIVLDYEVIENATNLVITKDTIFGVESFDITESPFSNTISKEETAVRIMRNIANEIKLRLSAIDWAKLNSANQ